MRLSLEKEFILKELISSLGSKFCLISSEPIDLGGKRFLGMLHMLPHLTTSRPQPQYDKKKVFQVTKKLCIVSLIKVLSIIIFYFNNLDVTSQIFNTFFTTLVYTSVKFSQ